MGMSRAASVFARFFLSEGIKKFFEMVHPKQPIGSVLFSHDKYDARLLEYDLSSHAQIIDDAAAAAIPMLEHHPALPAMYGKPARMRRDVGFFADPADTVGYSFSSQTQKVTPLPMALQWLLLVVNEVFDTSYNGILVNHYSDGNDYISDHRDDESALDRFHGILTISVGSSRVFRLKEWDNMRKAPFPRKERPWVDTHTKSYYGLLMEGIDFQKVLSHGIPPTKIAVGSRTSFTFRNHIA